MGTRFALVLTPIAWLGLLAAQVQAEHYGSPPTHLRAHSTRLAPPPPGVQASASRRQMWDPAVRRAQATAPLAEPNDFDAPFGSQEPLESPSPSDGAAPLDLGGSSEGLPAEEMPLPLDQPGAQPLDQPSPQPSAEPLVTPQTEAEGTIADDEMLEPVPWGQDMHAPGPMGFDSPAPTSSSGSWLRNGGWYSQTDAMYVCRSEMYANKRFHLATDFSSPLFREQTLEIDRSMGYTPGARFTLGKFLLRDPYNRDHTLEFSFLGLFDWDVNKGIQSRLPNSIETDIDPLYAIGTPFISSDKQEFFQGSRLTSYELNYRVSRRLGRDQLVYSPDGHWVRMCKPSHLPTLYAGVRVININETLTWLAESADATRRGDYQVSTHNNLIGLQSGLDWFWEHCQWRVGVRLKGGAFVNYADQFTHVVFVNPDNPLPDRQETGTKNALAFAGDLSFMGSYQIRPNVALRGSYDMLFVSNIAVAENQLTFRPVLVGDVNTQRTILYHGVSFGLEFVW